MLKYYCLTLIMNSGYITLPNSEEIYFQEWGAEFRGKDPSLIFLHGNLSTCQWWRDAIDNLSHINRNIIALDQRGFGKSSYKNTCNRLVSWANDLRDFCKAKGIEKCIPNGWSFGGAVAMKFAQIAPELVSKLVLTCTVSNEGIILKKGDKKCLTREEISQHDMVKWIMQKLQQNQPQEWVQANLSSVYAFCKHIPRESLVKLQKGSFLQRCYIDSMEALAHPEIDISKIKSECLVIHGSHDQIIPWEDVKHMKEHFKNVQLWQSNAHLIPVESPKEYAKAIADFIQC